MKAGTLSISQLTFIRRHWQLDMSTFEIARYFNVEPEVIIEACKFMKLKIRNLRLTAFHTPYPFQIAREVRKATIDDCYWKEDCSDGKNQTHSAIAGRSAGND